MVLSDIHAKRRMMAIKNSHTTLNRAEDDDKFVEALGRGLRVLECFRPSERFLGNAEIAKRTGLTKPAVSQLTFTLCELGYLSYSPDKRRYCLGTAVITLGHNHLAGGDIRRVARPLMQSLAEYTHASVHLGIRDQLSMVYIDTYRATSSFTVQFDVGPQVTIANTSMGRAYLSALPETDRTALLEQIRKNDEQNWPRVKAGIDQAVRDYREMGFCMSLGDWRSEVNAIAVPLICEDGTIMLFSCSGAAFQMPRQMLVEDIGPRLNNLTGNVRTALSMVNK